MGQNCNPPGRGLALARLQSVVRRGALHSREESRMMRTLIAAAAAALLCLTVLTRPLPGQAPVLGYDDTPMQPNGKWRVHDSHRPQPPALRPASDPGPAPSDATGPLGNAGDLSPWKMPNG